MLKLRPLILEFLLKEIGEQTSLYHRSSIKLKPGDIIKPNIGKTGTHWLAEKPFEIALESYRPKDKPSRFNCVYSTLVTRSRFVDKGYLYEIKPRGRLHIVDSTEIDKMAEEFDRELYDSYEYRELSSFSGSDKKEEYNKFLKDPDRLSRFLHGGYYYWEGTEPNRNNIKDIEVLSDSAVVIREIVEDEKSAPFRINDNVVVTENNKLSASIEFYINTPEGRKQNKIDMSNDDIVELKEWCEKNLFSKVDKIDGWPHKVENEFVHFKIEGYLKKGAKLKIIDAVHSIRSGGKRSRQDQVSGKYESLMLDFYKDDKLISRDRSKNDKNIYHRFMIAYWYYYGKERVYNFANYLKKI